MSLKEEFSVAVASGQTAICISTDEQPDALVTMSEVCKRFQWEMRIWDRCDGVTNPDAKKAKTRSSLEALTTPSLVDTLGDFRKEVVKTETSRTTGNSKKVVSILVVRNFELVNELPINVVTMLHHLCEEGKTDFKFVVLLVSPGTRLPPLLSPIFYTIEHELPAEPELSEILDGVLPEDAAAKLPDDTRRAVLKAALGLNRLQAEGAFATSLQRLGEVRADAVWRYKVNQINEEGLITIHEGPERFADVGGLDGAKGFLTSLLAYDEFDRDDPAVRAKGVTMLGAPGTGKSLIAKCLGNETARPVILANIGRLLGGVVGRTEENTRRLFRILERLAPCIAVLDEFGKQMPSTTSKDNDSGVSARLAGEFLSQMNDMKEDVFWVLSDNDITHVDRGFTRAERIDAIIYVRLPSQAQRAAVWSIYFKKFFPPVINGKKYPRHIELNVDTLLIALKADKDPDLQAWADKLAPALMCLHGDKRAEAKRKLEQVSKQLRNAIETAMINDEEWTPAEICACVRLMRRLKKPLREAQNVIGHVARGDHVRIEKIENWCKINGALDAETGELLELSDADKKELTAAKKRRRQIIEDADPMAN